MNFPFPNSHLPIKYHLPFTKSSDKWLMSNNLANGKCLMPVAAGGTR